MYELYDIDELPVGTFLLSFIIINCYHRDDLLILEKLNSAEYQKSFLCRDRNTIKLVTYKIKIVFPQKLQKYIVKWYNTYLLRPVLNLAKAIISQHLY